MTREQAAWKYCGQYTYRQRAEYRWVTIRTKARYKL